MSKEQNIGIYQHTKSICANISIPESNKVTWFVDHKNNSILNKEGNILVEPIDTVNSLIKWHKTGKTAVLNMASSKRKGGGVENGSVAQEECLFRCSNLFMIPDDFYPIKPNEFIYTKEASFVKDGQYNLLEQRIIADVITIPAINLNNSHIDFSNPINMDDYETYMLDKIYFMLNEAVSNKCDNVILGAWGCGVFKNDPKVVAKLFHQILIDENMSKQFNNIIFAIINDNNSVANNYQIFHEQFNKK